MCSCAKVLDSLSVYETTKVVRVRDKRLALVRALFLISMLGYIVYQYFGNYQYAKFFPPTGQSAMEVLFKSTNEDYTFNKSHKYCKEKGYECVIWDENEFVYFNSVNQLFLTTHFDVSHQVRNDCNISCKTPWKEVKNESYYISQMEDYTVKVTTTYQTQLGGGSQQVDSGLNMTYYLEGELVDQNGNTIKSMGAKQSDAFHITELLQAAGLSIDDLSDWTYNAANGNKSFRAWGMLLIVTIDMKNKYRGLLVEPTYTYSVSRVKEKKFLEIQMIPDSAMNKQQRELYRRYGIQIVFGTTGQLGAFDVTTCLLTLVSANFMWAVSTMVVEFFMLKVLSNKKHYQRVKIDDVGYLGTSVTEDAVSIGDEAGYNTF